MDEHEDLNSQMYEVEKKDVAQAQKKLAALGKLWETHWIPIGKGLFAGRKFCMRITQSPTPSGRPYEDAFGAWLFRNGFAEQKDHPEKPGLREKERTFLLRCMTHIKEIEAWRATLTEFQRRSWNHPRTVWERFEAATSPPPDGDLGNLEEQEGDLEMKPGSSPKAKAKSREGKLSELEKATDLADAYVREIETAKNAEINDLKATIVELKERILELRAIVLKVGGTLPD